MMLAIWIAHSQRRYRDGNSRARSLTTSLPVVIRPLKRGCDPDRATRRKDSPFRHSTLSSPRHGLMRTWTRSGSAVLVATTIWMRKPPVASCSGGSSTASDWRCSRKRWWMARLDESSIRTLPSMRCRSTPTSRISNDWYMKRCDDLQPARGQGDRRIADGRGRRGDRQCGLP
jgi:hypothetical protein